MSDDSDDEASCPLCMEDLDADDINFFPCTCGYQVPADLNIDIVFLVKRFGLVSILYGAIYDSGFIIISLSLLSQFASYSEKVVVRHRFR